MCLRHSIILVGIGAVLLGGRGAAQEDEGGNRSAILLENDSATPSASYGQRHALIIGIDKYLDPGFPQLQFATKDALGIYAMLRDFFGFPEDNMRLLLDDQASAVNIRVELDDWLGDNSSIGQDDLVIVYFAGHGVTREGQTGERKQRDVGYLVPVDAQTKKGGNPKYGTSIEMKSLGDAADRIPCKHVLFILDCCFSGLAATRSSVPIAPGLRDKARQIICAGTKDQRVADGGGGGHSVFTGALLRGLKGDADVDDDGVFTFGEIYRYVSGRVERQTESRQRPIFATFPGHEGGSVALFPPNLQPPEQNEANRLSRLQQAYKGKEREVDQLSDTLVVRGLRENLSALWPRRPELLPAIRRFRSDAEALIGRFPEHQSTLHLLKQQALSRQISEGVLEKTATQIDSAKLETRLRFRLESFEELVASAPKVQEMILEADERMKIAETVVSATVDAYEDEWAETIEVIFEDPRFLELEIEPQVGLIPLGPDPRSRLCEFLVWETGEPPERNPETDLWIVNEDTGVILVLLPGGETTIGSSTVATDPNYDPLAQDDETPCHRVHLDPFFLSRYELTQRQWQSLTDEQPSLYNSTEDALESPGAHPVENITASHAEFVLSRIELTLPTEAQWEFAARANHGEPWCSSRDELSLYANLADESLRRTPGSDPETTYASWDDNHPLHAAVGLFLPNGFGLHDIHGNIAEFCRDGRTIPPSQPRSGDGLRKTARLEEQRVVRGASFYGTPEEARFAARSWGLLQSYTIGIRPARPLFP